MTIFLKKSLDDRLRLDCKGFDFFLNQIYFNDDAEKNIRMILKEAQRLPAALGGYHGGYRGGLYDHILLVTNLSYRIYYKPEMGIKKLGNLKVPYLQEYSETKIESVIKAALYHDFGKIPYYLFRRGIRDRKVITLKLERDAVHKEIVNRFGYKGNDEHVEECIAVLKKFNIPFDDEIYQAIIFHHGWRAKYRPLRFNTLGTLLHLADMIASRQYRI
ncbi:MAG: HD domain-containing protein [Promethearchaeota archaeon]|nr:MAG: HD domain-containing protein [Candidatus Lokiarchaeota archaeon]